MVLILSYNHGIQVISFHLYRDPMLYATGTLTMRGSSGLPPAWPGCRGMRWRDPCGMLCVRWSAAELLCLASCSFPRPQVLAVEIALQVKALHLGADGGVLGYRSLS
jgi:hypothetical protein